jgi:serine-type D-Ala-D-Ala carboxypeptidase (penicillin-binding protein 5/6)
VGGVGLVSSRLLVAAAALATVAVLAVAATAAATPPVSAPVYVVESSVDGSTLAARHADRRHAIASITKLMTVLVALERSRLDDVVVVPAAATRIGESTLSLRAGERVTVRDLAIGALVPSANDAATTLAYHAGGGSVARFVGLMNEKARALGLHGTHFSNPHGLDEAGNYSTARDVAHLLRTARRVPFIRMWTGRSTATIAGGRHVETTDDLLSVLPSLLGAKTGHTADAGWSQVATARRRGATITVAVLGARSEEARNADLAALLDWGLAQYRPVLAIDARRTYARADPGWGLSPVSLHATRSVARPAAVRRPLVERVVAPQVLALPVNRGQRLGAVRVYDGTRLVASAPLVADRDVAQPGTLAKTEFVARRTFHHLAGLVS